MQACRESSIVAAIVRKLRNVSGVTVRKRHGTAWGMAGDPDLYGSVRGRHFEIEVKAPGGQPTALQERRLAEWKAADALTGIAHCAADALRILGLDAERP